MYMYDVPLGFEWVSESVSQALKLVSGDETQETVRFEAMIKFFHTLNVTNFTNGKVNRKPSKIPIVQRRVRYPH